MGKPNSEDSSMVKNIFKKTRKKEKRGATLLEYGMVTGFIALAGIGSVMMLGERTERTFCEASTAIGRIIYNDPTLNCEPEDVADVVDPVVVPAITQTDFEDVLYPNATQGPQNVLVVLSESLPGNITLNTNIVSQNPYQSNRTIASCYEAPSEPQPVCSTPGASSSIAVPSNATALGYQVDVEQDTDMPWENIVNISIPENAEDHSVSVDREEAPVLISGIALSIPDEVFFPEVTGWQYGTFSPLEGEFNRHLQFYVVKDSNNFSFRSCFVQNEGDTPSCGASSSSEENPVLVPPGTQQLGYMIYLPDEGVKPDWVGSMDYDISYDESSLVQDSFLVTRLNSEVAYGGVSALFSDPYTFDQFDAEWTFGEFIDIDGPRNVPVTFEMGYVSGDLVLKSVCYKMSIDGGAACGSSSMDISSVDVPAGAAQIGYRFYLPEAAPNYGDLSMDVETTVSYEGTVLDEQEFTVVRPNPGFQTAGISENFSDPYRYEETDTEWTDGEFVTIDGARNMPMIFDVTNVLGNGTLIRACYKTSAEGSSYCGSTSNDISTVDAPISATHVGYKMYLPETGPSDTDWSIDIATEWSFDGTAFDEQEFTVIRPNPDFVVAGISEEFSDPYNYEETDTTWTYGEFIAVDGPRNTPMTFAISRSFGEEFLMQACYQTSSGGSTYCQNSSTETSTIELPSSATHVGYRMYLPDPGASATDLSIGVETELSFDGTVMDEQEFTVIRPNPRLILGGIGEEFSDPYNYEETDTAWTHGEYIAIEGPRNSDVTFAITRVAGENILIKACYKTNSNGTPSCASSSRTTATVNVPAAAVEVGYQMYLPEPGASDTDWSMDVETELSFEGTVLDEQELTVVRPNPAYQTGGISENFSASYNYEETDTSLTNGEFIAIEGPRNIPVDFEITRTLGDNVLMKACYITSPGGNSYCGSAGRPTASVEVPVNAIEVGYQIYLPAAGPSDTNWSIDLESSLSFQGTSMDSQSFTAVRPNPAYQVGDISESFTNNYTFDEDTSSWNYAEFIDIDGTRNTDMTFELNHTGGEGTSKQACYSTTVGGNYRCSSSQSGTKTATIEVPPEAVQVGYRVYFPATGPAHTDWSMDLETVLSFQGTTYDTQNFTVVRENPDYQTGSVSGFPTNYTFPRTDTSWSYVYFNYNGPRNTDVRFKSTRTSGDARSHSVCYKTSSTGSNKCSGGSTGNSTYTIPENATHIGFRVHLPSVGTEISIQRQYTLEVDGEVFFTRDVNITRND